MENREHMSSELVQDAMEKRSSTLSVLYDIVLNKHKGRLLVESRSGKGIKFTVKPPIHSGEVSEEEANEKPDGSFCG